MENIMRTVALADIDFADLSFVATAGRGTGQLKQSISAVGLLQPPSLWRATDSNPYAIVCGFRRLRALRELGAAEVPALALDAASERQNLLAVALHDNLAHRAFNSVEIAMALKRLLGCLPRRTVIAEWLPQFGLAPAGRELDRLLLIGGLEQNVLEGLLQGSLTEKSAAKLAGLAPEDRRELYHLMQQLHLSSSNQAELLECLVDLSRRDGLPIRELVALSDIQAVCADMKLSRPQKTGRVRDVLRRMHSPRLAKAEARQRQALKALCIPSAIRIKPPPHFEGETYTAELTFSSAAALQRACRHMLELSEQEAFAQLLEKHSPA